MLENVNIANESNKNSEAFQFISNNKTEFIKNNTFVKFFKKRTKMKLWLI